MIFFSVCAQATSIISTAPGGALAGGYQGAAATSLANGNKVCGHVTFKNGFTVPAGTLTCAGLAPSIISCDSDGIIQGSVIFSDQGSVLDLRADLRLGSTSFFSIPSSGGLQGNSKSIFLGSDVNLNNALLRISKTSPLTIDGCGNVLKLVNTTLAGCDVASYNQPFDYAPLLTLRNMIFAVNNGYTTSAIVFNYFKEISLENMTFLEINTSGDYLFYNQTLQPTVTKKLRIKGKVIFSGPPGSVIDFYGADIIIEKNSTLQVSSGLVVRNIRSVTMTNATSILHLNGCSFYTGNTIATEQTIGMMLTKGTILFENQVKIFNKQFGSDSNSNFANGLIFGDGNYFVNDADVRVLAGAYVTVDGCMKFNPCSVELPPEVFPTLPSDPGE